MKEEIVKSYSKYTSKLVSEYGTLLASIDNPELILTSLFDSKQHQTYYNYITTALREEGLGYQEIQNFLISLIREYFKGFDSEVELDKLYDQYPATIVVKYKNYKVLTFSFYNHNFSKEINDNFIDGLSSSIEGIRKRIERQEKKVSMYEKYIGNPIEILHPKNYRSKGSWIKKLIFADVLKLIIFNKQIKTNLGLMVDKEKDFIERDAEEIENYEKRIEEYKEILPVLEEKYTKWERKMIELGYSKITK